MALYSDDLYDSTRLVREVADELIGKARTAMLRVFDNLELQGPGIRSQENFRFKRGRNGLSLQEPVWWREAA